jgi:hypothetical protein
MVAGVAGNTTTVLSDFAGGNIFDEISTVSVSLVCGELSSDTESNVLNGSNLALVGSELVHFKNAELVADGKYILSGFIRGVCGTSLYMGTHVVSERFVLLTEETVRILHGSVSELNLERFYKAGSFGSRLPTSYLSFTNTGVALKCLPPCHIGGGRVANAINCTWVRRDRLGASWGDADAPMSETTELYEVDIFSDSTYTTVLRTVTGLTTPAMTYSAADQVTDFGSVQATIYIEVFQISSVTNRGFGAKGVV